MYYLVDKATEYAHIAVASDRSGDYDKAIKYYKLAIEMFSKYLKLYPDNSMADFYRELIKKYRARIEVLEKYLTRVTSNVRSGNTSSDESGDGFTIIDYSNGNGPKFDDLVDLDNVKKALKRSVIYPVKSPDLYPLGWSRGILLFGPPGCGKTLISMALANEIKAYMFSVTPATIMSKWLGEAEKNVAKLFNKAREILASSNKPVIVFIDEVDALFQEYSDEMGSEKRVRNQFLIEMDGLKSKEDDKLPLLVIGATNKPWKLDIGFIRRFDKRIYVPPPDKEIRKKIFEHYISKLSKVYDVSNVDIDKLAEMTENYSPDDIRKIVKEIQSEIAEAYYEKNSNGQRVLKTEDFIKVIEKRKPSIDPQLLESYEIWFKKYGAE
ncbi:MAG: AAA family ATPase [Desulfurococcaceae archaeon]